MNPKVTARYEETVVRNPSIEVRFTEEVTTLSSQVSWQNPSVLRGLSRMFGVRPDEEITAIEITEAGIKACFRRKTGG